MPQVPQPSVQNKFTGGLKTEFTGLNFPEDSWISGDNVISTIIGDVIRREGFSFEANAAFAGLDRTGKAMSTYKWNNVGGDGSTQIVVAQIGSSLNFYRSSSATIVAPLSTTSLGTIDFSQFSVVANITVTGAGTGAANVINLQVTSTVGLTTGDTVTISGVLGTLEANGTFTIQVTGPVNINLIGTTFVHAYISGGIVTKRIDVTECQYTDGNGYLFVFHPNCDPFFVTYNAGSLNASVINIQVRDFVGVPEPGVLDNFRSSTLSSEHNYNLLNQGWAASASWSTFSNTNYTYFPPPQAGEPFLFTTAGLGILVNDLFVATSNTNPSYTITGQVTSVLADRIIFTETSNSIPPPQGGTFISSWNLVSNSSGKISAWHASALGNYPSNADVWWQFKNSSGVFDPATTAANVTLSSGPAPKGSFIVNAFNVNRTAVSAVTGITTVSTTLRPKTGAWYQGRVWYSGVDASFAPSGDEPFSTWTENIYFSQIVQTTAQFSRCHQTNDPTSETLFNLLPTDGGVIVIQGSGSIYKLFPIQTGLFVFAANGIWYISGSSGIGFSASDYTITKVAGIQSTSSTSFISVLGWPFFWNEEGIYEVVPSGQADTQNNRHNFFQVNNLALGTILTLYQNIPIQSKKFARGDYHPLDYIIQWCYRDTNESSVTDRYQFNRILNFNTATKAFYTYTLGSPSTSGVYIHGINYVAGPGGSTSPAPVFKYLTSYVTTPYTFSFSEEIDATFVDWAVFSGGTSFTSTFTTGYNLKGKAVTKFQVPYLYMFSRNSSQNKYIFQSLWDYAGTSASGRWSARQVITNNKPNYTTLYRRHRLRGQGLAVQIQITSVAGQPFDFIGWSMWNEVRQHI